MKAKAEIAKKMTDALVNQKLMQPGGLTLE